MALTIATDLAWPVPPSPAELSIYTLATPLTRQADVRALADRLEVAPNGVGVEWRLTDRRISLRRGPLELRVDRASGGFQLRNRLRFQVDDGSNIEISDTEADSAAGRVLRRFGLATGELDVAAVTRFHAGTVSRDGTGGSERTVDVGVIYRRRVDRLLVEGPGGEVRVYLDAFGELTGIDHLVRPIAGVLRTVEAVRPREAVVRGFERHFAHAAAATVTLTEVRFGHFEHGWGVRQRTLQPAFVGFFRLSADDERLHRRSVHVLPAATNPAGPLLPRGAGPSSIGLQAPRRQAE